MVASEADIKGRRVAIFPGRREIVLVVRLKKESGRRKGGTRRLPAKQG